MITGTQLLLFILICFGATKILVWGSIFNKIRPNFPPFNCSLCMGFWVGALVYYLMFFNFNWLTMVIYACLSAGTSYLLDNLIDDNGIRIEIIKGEKNDSTDSN